MEILLTINGCDFEFLTKTERDVVNTLDEFNVMGYMKILEQY